MDIKYQLDRKCLGDNCNSFMNFNYVQSLSVSVPQAVSSKSNKNIYIYIYVFFFNYFKLGKTWARAIFIFEVNTLIVIEAIYNDRNAILYNFRFSDFITLN